MLQEALKLEKFKVMVMGILSRDEIEYWQSNACPGLSLDLFNNHYIRLLINISNTLMFSFGISVKVLIADGMGLQDTCSGPVQIHTSENFLWTQSKIVM
jgi:hypothetical protein